MKALKILLFFCTTVIYSQPTGWSSFYSFNQITGVHSGRDGQIYGVAQNSLLSYDLNSNEVIPITTVDGLLGDEIDALTVTDHFIVIGYRNGMLGIHRLLDGSVTLDSSILRNLSIEPKDKTIHSFLVQGQTLYVSAGYGISKYDLSTNRFIDSYFFGLNNSTIQVNQTALLGDFLYAATEEGLYKGNASDPNLALESAWNKIADGEWKSIAQVNNVILGVVQFGSQVICYRLIDDVAIEHHRESGALLGVEVGESELVLSFSNSILAFDNSKSVRTLATASGPLSEHLFTSASTVGNELFIGTAGGGLLLHNPSETRVVSPSGPLMNDIFEISVLPNEELWIAHGAFSRYYNPYPLNAYGVSHRSSRGSWQNLPFSALLGARSIVSVVPNPANPSQVFACSMHHGLLEINDGLVTNLWNQTNSGLESLDPIELSENPNYRSVRIRDLAFDSEGSMWSITSFVGEGLKKRTVNGDWESVDLTGLIAINQASGYSKLVISPNDEIYFGSAGYGLIGYAEINGTPVLRSLDVADNLPTVDVRSVTLDFDNNLWIGTTEGLRVLYSASRLFSQSGLSASTLILEEGGNIGELLANQFINAIEVDGNNQKWVATDGAGVFLFAEDGKKTLQHFTKENSPLPTNSVRSLAYEPQSGKIYMGTPNGLVAFQGNAYGPSENLEETEVYPNPIRPGYTGLLTIRGLQADCVVKITDIVGNAVFETTATGGSVQWDLRSFAGDRVRSGVYLIFVTTNDGLESAVEKVMIIN
jgi:hypothetical protein